MVEVRADKMLTVLGSSSVPLLPLYKYILPLSYQFKFCVKESALTNISLILVWKTDISLFVNLRFRNLKLGVNSLIQILHIESGCA